MLDFAHDSIFSLYVNYVNYTKKAEITLKTSTLRKLMWCLDLAKISYVKKALVNYLFDYQMLNDVHWKSAFEVM